MECPATTNKAMVMAVPTLNHNWVNIFPSLIEAEFRRPSASPNSAPTVTGFARRYIGTNADCRCLFLQEPFDVHTRHMCLKQKTHVRVNMGFSSVKGAPFKRCCSQSRRGLPRRASL